MVAPALTFHSLGPFDYLKDESRYCSVNTIQYFNSELGSTQPFRGIGGAGVWDSGLGLASRSGVGGAGHRPLNFRGP